MVARISVKGQMVIPEAVREQARIKSGDEMDVGYANGLVVLRKRRALTPIRVRSLLLTGRELPELTLNDEAAVARAVQRVRNRSQVVKVVFDTNVVVSASFWRGAPFDCLNAWAQERFEAVVSPALLAEYHEVVEELHTEFPNRPCVAWVQALTDAATLVFPMERATGALQTRMMKWFWNAIGCGGGCHCEW